MTDGSIPRPSISPASGRRGRAGTGRRVSERAEGPHGPQYPVRPRGALVITGGRKIATAACVSERPAPSPAGPRERTWTP